MNRKIALLVKRIFDIVSSLIILVLFSPLIVVISLLMKFYDGAPIFFLQPRLGLHGKPFVIFKFRTMKNTKDEKLGPGVLLIKAKKFECIKRVFDEFSVDYSITKFWGH